MTSAKPALLSTLRLACAAVGVCAVVLFAAGCDKKPAASEPAATAAGAAGSTGVSVGEQEAANTTYPSENSTSGMVRLVNGHYADDEQLVVDHENALDAVGDLDGDGSDDRAVVLVTSTGGSGIFRELYLLRRIDGQLRVSPPALLGDRVEVNSLRVEGTDLLVDLVVQGPNDPLCCPTQHVVWRFHLQGDTLVETSGQQQAYLKQ